MGRTGGKAQHRSGKARKTQRKPLNPCYPYFRVLGQPHPGRGGNRSPAAQCLSTVVCATRRQLRADFPITCFIGVDLRSSAARSALLRGPKPKSKKLRWAADERRSTPINPRVRQSIGLSRIVESPLLCRTPLDSRGSVEFALPSRAHRPADSSAPIPTCPPRPPAGCWRWHTVSSACGPPHTPSGPPRWPASWRAPS